MDGQRFDDLTRALAAGTSRRRVLKGLLGGIGGGALALAGATKGDAARLRPLGANCNRDDKCASGVCDLATKHCACPPGQVACSHGCVDSASFQTDPANCGGCGRVCLSGVCTGGVCGAGPSAVLGASCSGGGECASGSCVDGVCCAEATCSGLDTACQVGVCQPGTGACSVQPRANGTACDDGNACTQTDTCQDGACTGGNPVVCAAADQCHQAGVCQPGSGTCTYADRPEGTVCDDGNPCTVGETCQAGVCRGGAPVSCPAPTICQVSVTCDPGLGTCVALNRPNGTICGAETACSHDICVAGVCRVNEPKPAGAACNDANACTQADACDGAGSCLGGAPVTCPPPDACHAAGTCDTGTGQCGPNAILADRCFIGGACYASGDPDPATPCRVCDPNLSQTAFAPGNEGGTCDDGNACTQTDTCQNGVCVGGNPVVCAASDACHSAGTCDPDTGVCSNPNAANGTACDDNDAATCNDTCQAGVCTGAPCPTVCTDGRDVCGAVCCPVGQTCVAGVCRTPCGATTCDPGTQFCCVDFVCCTTATQVCNSIGVCGAPPVGGGGGGGGIGVQ
ncbi:MAG: conserved hypothetical protein with Kelch motif [uncultured Thermomicrobiales bacterium]|uniref:Uncharacterized protein n=1 Tax=uncultured Thermomicrobiales bacterium TaxID=1645740 RepID=A0A6J4UMN8_9BACT|nr:MAG: conserved hypothetical protein with Kelch motif [uncultured Thermomicrobiales bacterium]